MSRRLLWLIPLFLLAFWLGARMLDADPIWGDEWYSIYDSGSGQYGPLTPDQIWNRVAQRNPWHAPGYFILLSQWEGLVGHDPAALRALSLLFGVLAIAWTYRLGCEVASRRVGLVAAGILATSAMFVHYLHEVRHYALIALLTAFTFWIYLRIVRSRTPPAPFMWLGLLAGATLLLYTHYFAALVLVAIGIYHLLLRVRVLRLDNSNVDRTSQGGSRTAPTTHLSLNLRVWWGVFGVLALAGLLFLPWVNVFVSGLSLATETDELNSRALTDGEVLYNVAYLFGNGSFLLLGATLALSLRPARGTKTAWGLALGILAPMLVINALLHVIPITRIRYLITLWVPLALVVGLAMVALDGWGRAGRWAARGLLAAWLVVGVWSSLGSDVVIELGGAKHLYPMQVMQRAIAPRAQDDDLLVNFLPADPVNFRINNRSAEFYFDPLPLDYVLIVPNPDPFHGVEQDSVPPELLDGRQRVWLATMPDMQPPTYATFEDTLATDYNLCGVVEQRPNLHLALYSRLPICCGTEQTAAPILRYGDGIALTGVDGLPAEVDSTLRVTLAWAIAAGVPIHSYSVSLQVIDAGGQKVAQADYGLPPLATTCQPTTFDTRALASGEYTLMATVYAWQTGARLPGGVVATGETGELLTVGTFRKG